MTTVQEIQDLAADLQTERPDWPDIVPISNYLLPWRHLPADELRAMALAWVKDHGNRTPASLKYMTGVPPKSSGISSTGRKAKEPLCYICGNTRTKCAELNAFEVANNLPDPHQFETSADAYANRSDRQWPDIKDDMNRLRGERAKERADRARAEIRPLKTTVAGRPSVILHDEPPRKCEGCGGTLARHQPRYHPGCDPQPQPELEETPA